VLAFFGVFAVAGSHYLQSGVLSATALLAGLAVGGPAAAVLLINNYRDLAGDVAVGRHTLAALLGRSGSQRAYRVLMLLPFALTPLIAWHYPGALLALAALPRALALVRRLPAAGDAAGLNAALAGSARLQLAFGLLFALGVNL
jgi:1,4-dihydroxy-2-naphthoate octaprenyltransferase